MKVIAALAWGGGWRSLSHLLCCGVGPRDSPEESAHMAGASFRQAAGHRCSSCLLWIVLAGRDHEGVPARLARAASLAPLTSSILE